MNEDVFNMSIRKFLKQLGITAQREIEIAVRDALARGAIGESDALHAEATITLAKTRLNLVVDGEIKLK